MRKTLSLHDLQGLLKPPFYLIVIMKALIPYVIFMILSEAQFTQIIMACWEAPLFHRILMKIKLK